MSDYLRFIKLMMRLIWGGIGFLALVALFDLWVWYQGRNQFVLAAAELAIAVIVIAVWFQLRVRARLRERGLW